MNNAKLTAVQRLVNRLSEHEIETLKQFLIAFEHRKGRSPKTLLLLELLLSGKSIVSIEKQLPKALGTKSSDAIRMVIHRLKEKINECLLLDINTSRKGVYDDSTKAFFEICRKLLIVPILGGRGLKKEGLALNDKIIATAKKYEFYTQLIDALLYKQTAMSLIKGKKASDALEEEIQFYEECRNSTIKAERAYYRVIQNYSFKGHGRNSPDGSHLMEVKKEVEELRTEFDKTSSPIVGYYYYLLQIEYFQALNEYDKASEYCLLILDIIRNNPSVLTRQRLGIANLNLSQNEIYNFYFDYSIGFAKEARNHLRPESVNYLLAYELEFYANFYAGKIETAAGLIDQLVPVESADKADTSAFRIAWRNYLSACISFLKKDYKSVHFALNNASEINKDKIGWNIASRVLSIITSIDQEHLDLADSQILNLQQFIKQSLKGQSVTERDQTILKVLLLLRKESYAFPVVAQKALPELDLLSNDEKGTRWEVLSPELIIFHKWFESKLKDREYTPDYSKNHVRSAFSKSS